MNLQESTLYLDRYQLQWQIGKGGMSDVWLAHDLELEADVALKFLNKAYSDNWEALRKETRNARRLSHRHIIPVYDYHFQEGQFPAISMEYAPGGSLAMQVTKERPCLEVSELSDWMIQACEGFAYAHEEASIIHRDIKPANLMLDDAGALKICDFGVSASLAVGLDEEPDDGVGVSLTLHYASPQLIWNPKQCHHSNDIYALGVTIFVLLTNTYPFEDPRENRWPWNPDRLLSMSERRKERGREGEPIPESWDYAVARCLAEDPDDRPASMSELAEMLGAEEYYRRKGGVFEAILLPQPGSEQEGEQTGVFARGKISRSLLLILVFLAMGLLTGVLWKVYQMYQEQSIPDDTVPTYEVLAE